MLGRGGRPGRQDVREGQERTIASERSAPRAPEAVVLEGAAVAVRQSKDAHRRHGAAWFMVGLGLLQSRPLHERILLGLVVLAALMGMARENQARTIARLVAWDKRQILRQQRMVRARRGRRAG